MHEMTAEGSENMEQTDEDRRHDYSAVAELTSHVCRISVLLGMDMPLSSLENSSCPACQ